MIIEGILAFTGAIIGILIGFLVFNSAAVMFLGLLSGLGLGFIAGVMLVLIGERYWDWH